MQIQIKLSDGAVLPANAHESDTGYDIIAVSEPKIVGTLLGDQEGPWSSIDYIEYDTGISVAPPFRFYQESEGQECEPDRSYGYLDVRPRSSISKYNLVLANSPATIDFSFRGTIKLRFKYVFQPEDLFILGDKILGRVNPEKIYKRGEKIGQLIAAWKEPIYWEQVDELPETARADGGFGSSGR